jgi:uncharacterized protein
VKIKVRVIPNAKRNEVTVVDQGWVLRLKAPAVEGKANKAAVSFLAETLEIPRAAVVLVSGEKSRHKIFEIVGLDRSDVERRLARNSATMGCEAS